MSLLRPRVHHALRIARPSVRNWTSVSTARSGEGLVVDALNSTFSFVWLRDSCQSSDCIHPSTSQKLHRSSDIPRDIRPAEGGVRPTGDGLQIDWLDGHQSFFHRDFLRRHSSATHLAKFHADLSARTWGRAEISGNPDLFVEYRTLQDKTGLAAAMEQLIKDGLLFVTGVPNEETSDSGCELRALASKFSYIRETFYGQVWDVVNLRNSRNIAYTNLDLGLHMDLLYFKHPPKYQILHCLRNRVEGGSSLFVDAFGGAEALHAADPEAFNLLATQPVLFHYINDGHHLHHAHNTIELEDGQISQINYSPPFQAPLPVDTPVAFYEALAKYAGILGDSQRTFSYTLREGDAVIFDNRRVLHARAAFHDREGEAGKEGEPNRWLKGCYFEADALLDRARVLRKNTFQ